MEVNVNEVIDINLERELSLFLNQHPHGNFFQSIDLFNHYKRRDNIEPFFITVHEKGVLVGTLLGAIFRERGRVKGFFSRRCIIEGGPIVQGGVEILGSILSKLNAVIRSKAIYTEFRNFNDTSNDTKCFEDYGYRFSGHLNFLVETPDHQTVWKNLSKSRKREINKSLKNGAEICEAQGLKDVIGLYELLVKLYTEVVKKPLPSLGFFSDFYELQLGKIFIIKYEEEIVGGIVCPIFRDTIYEWYVCGMDSNFRAIYPSVLATWSPIDYAIRNDLKYFDFLGAGQPDKAYGVRDFKSRFGGSCVNHGRYLRVNNKVKYGIGNYGLKIYNKMISA